MKKEKMNDKSQIKYIPGIDGLRAIAVLMVLAYHLRIPIAKGGILGVTIFFVISGFLITQILLSELEDTNTVNLRNFWIRRIKRLFPAMLAMATCLIFTSALFDRVLFTKTCSDLPSALLGYNNWWQIFNNVSYFENAGAPSPLTHFWSLAIEAQFYLVYPVLFKCFSKQKNRKKVLTSVTIAVAIFSLLLLGLLFNPSKDPSRCYYGTDTRVFSLLFGAALALVMKKSEKPDKKTKGIYDLVGIISGLVLIFMMSTMDGYSSFLYRGGQVIASLLTVLVIYSLLNNCSILNKVLEFPALRWIGERSYGIYLWHYPVILLLSNGKKSSWWLMLTEILLTFIFAALSYRYIETPIRYGVVKKNIAIIRRRVRTKEARKEQVRVLKRCLLISLGVSVIEIGVILCIVFVPKEKALDHIESLESQAEKAEKSKEEHVSAQKEATEKKSEPVVSDEQILQNLNLLLMGDSIAMGATDEFYEAFPNSISDTAVSRYTTESFDLYDSYVNENGWNGDGVIFALGTNGLLYNSLDTLREKIGPERPFFVITARAPYTNWEQSNNAEIYEFAESTDHTYLTDWYRESEGHPEYFAEDETHLTSEGAQAYINCIKKVVLEAFKK